MKKTLTFDLLFNKATFKAIFMIAGTAIGAGMLGIPLVTSSAGFFPATIVTIAVWLYMLITGLLLMEVSVSLKEDGGFLMMAEKYLPTGGKAVTAFLFICLYGILLVAYVSAGFEIFGLTFNDSFLTKIIFPMLLLGLLSLKANRVIGIISLLTIPMCLYFILFYFSGVEFVDIKRYSYGAYSKAYLAVPVLFGAFGYHNVIPSVAKYLDFDKKKLVVAIFFGSLVPCVIYLLWQLLIFGIVDLQTLELAREKGIPITVLLNQATSNLVFAKIGLYFAFFAILTSALGVGLSLVEFIDPKQNIKTIFGVILIPSIIAFVNPGIFLKALGFAGGVGESILNGMIPVFMYYAYKSISKEMTRELKFFTCSLFLIAAIVVIIELNNCF